MVSNNRGLINVALISSIIFPAIKVLSDIVSENSGSDKYGPGKGGLDKCSFDMVPDIVSDNPNPDKHGCEKCVVRRYDNPGCDE